MTQINDSTVVWHPHQVTQQQREAIKNQVGCVLWLTGLSGSGKSTIANMLEINLNKQGYHTYLLDGDNIRHGLNGDLGFNNTDRVENIRRISEVAKLFVDAGLIIITAFISPFKADRDLARSLLSKRYFEIFVDAPLKICEQRDPKGLYKKARGGKLLNFTGIDSIYELPSNPDLSISTEKLNVSDSVKTIEKFLYQTNIIADKNL